MRSLPISPSLALPTHADLVGDCTFCPKMCRFACPVAEAEARESATPAWKGTLVYQHLRGRLPLAGAVAEAAYRCTDCGLAEVHCLHGHAVPEPYAAVRAAAFAGGAAPERVTSFVDRVRAFGNPFEAELSARLRSVVPADALAADGARAELLLFPGCSATRHAAATIASARAVFERVERRPLPCAVSGGGCCGYPLYAAGDLEGFAGLARKTARSLEGARDVVSLDPGCVRAMNELWAEVGVISGIRARTLVEVLAECLDAVRAAIRAPIETETFSYHDPCLLGRFRGVYDEPRALLGAACAGRPPLELATSRERAWCSGAGGIYSKIWPGLAARIAGRRLAEHAESGASRLATACPSARRFLEKSAAPGAAPLDVIDVLARAMGIAPQ